MNYLLIYPKLILEGYYYFMDTTYAKLSNGKIIKAAKGMNRNMSFFCAGCSSELYAATEGRKQYPHFRHKSLNGKTGCSEPESYTHWITKELFAEHYRKSKDFFLSIVVQQKCLNDSCVKDEEIHINLKERYPYIKIEEPYGSFRPDCLLYNKGNEVLFFEVHYTNKVSENKINTNVPIIEAKVYNEKNIDEICRTGGFTIKKSTFFEPQIYYPVTLYNSFTLIPNSAKSFDCKNSCVDNSSHRKIKERHSKEIRVPHKLSAVSSSTVTVARRKTLPVRDAKAISYLSGTSKKRSNYAINTEIPSVLGQCISSYEEYESKYIDKSLSSDNFVVLEDRGSFLFISYNKQFIGVVRYEAIWHIFHMINLFDDDKKIVFIHSVRDKNSLENKIKEIFNTF